MVSYNTVLGRKPRAKLSGAVVGSALLFMFGACYSPDLSFEDCMLPCEQDCPSGAECRNNFCVHTGSPATCAAGGSAGSAGSASTAGGAGSAGSAGSISAGYGGQDSGGVGGDAEAGSAGAMAGAAGEASNELTVHFEPLGSLCPGQAFQALLSADYGQPPYTWTLSADSPAGTALSAASGSSVQVSGVASKPQLPVSVVTQDASGRSVTTTLALTIDPVGPGSCPQIEPTRLPDPCQEHEYYTNDVTVTGGTRPFTWQAVSLPAGLEFDGTTQTLTGTALTSGASTPLTLRVTDHKGHQTQKTYPLAYRDRCWLGFTSSESSVSKVHLFDPALAHRAPALETSSNNTGVVDFKFSPDGKFLAYRRSTGSPATDSLVLAIAPHWQEQVLDIPGSVLEYAWSNSSAALAVAFRDATDTLLGGVNVASASAVGSGAITGIQALTPVPMLDPMSAPLASRLTWFQSDTFLAFHAEAIPGTGFGDTPYYTNLDGAAFSAPVQMGLSFYDPAVQLLPAYHGIFAVSPETPPWLDFYGSPGGTDGNNFLRSIYTSAVADPEGLYVALPIKEKLQIYLTAESGGTTEVPTPWQPSADACSSILAWNPKRETVACDARGAAVDGGTANGEVRIFDLAGTQAVPQLSSTAVKLLTGYQQGDSLAQRRSFSAQGNWLAFTTDTALYVTSVQAAPQVVAVRGLPDGALASDPSELVFSPDEKLLLWQKGAKIGVFSVQKDGGFSWYSRSEGPLQAPMQCDEEFTAGPDKWCGRLHSAGAPAWSADSRFAAATTATGGVRVYNFEHYLLEVDPFHDACVTGCFGDYQFQP